MLNKAIAYTAQVAKLAQQKGNWREEEGATRLFLAGKGFTESDIQVCFEKAPFDPEKRLKLLASCFFNENWQDWAETWANPDEIQRVRDNAPTSRSAIATAPPEPPPSLEDRHIDLSQLEMRGRALEEGFRAYGLNVRFLPNESSDAGLRCDRLVFAKPLEVAYNAPQKFLAEALSNAGLDPESGVVFKRLPGNRFEMQVPRPQEQWRIAHLIPYLSDSHGLKILKNALQPPEERILQFRSHIRQTVGVLPHNPPRLPVLVDLEGRVEWISLSSHALIGGGSEGGKSSVIKTLLMSAEILYPPEWAQFVLFDFKDEAPTLRKFERSGYVWQSLPVCTRPDDAAAYWERLEAEAQERAKKIVSADCENLSEYNAVNPANPLPWLFLVIDEVGGYKRAKGDEADEWLQKCMSRWRSWGIICIASTQYPSAKYALGPDTRVNFKTKILLACDEGCAKLVLGENDRYVSAATRLVPPGDCLIKHSGRYVRGQALYIDPGLLKQFLSAHEKTLQAFDSGFLAA